jgi:hypothetical protein
MGSVLDKLFIINMLEKLLPTLIGLISPSRDENFRAASV